MPPGHIQGHLIRPDQGATYSLANLINSLVLAVRSAVPLLDESNALSIVASPHFLTILLHHQSWSEYKHSLGPADGVLTKPQFKGRRKTPFWLSTEG